MAARWVAFLTWAAVAVGSVLWILKLAVPVQAMQAHVQVVSTSPPSSGDLRSILGGDAPPQADAPPAAAALPVDTRFTLVGVVSPRPGSSSREGLALIAADEQPARAFRVGAAVDGALVLLSVSPRGASLGPRGGPASHVLELPELPAAATGAPGGPGDPGSARPGFQRPPGPRAAGPAVPGLAPAAPGLAPAAPGLAPAAPGLAPAVPGLAPAAPGLVSTPPAPGAARPRTP